MKTLNIKENLRNYYFVNPTAKLRVRQIEREIKAPLPSVIRYTKELEKEKILKKTEIAKVQVYSADRTSKNYLIEKKLFNIKQLYFSGLIEYLIENLDNPAMMLFGSYSKGEDIEDSDIDIYIETTKKNMDLEIYEKLLKRRIQLFIYKNIKEIENKNLANNIINGINLNGFIEVFK